VHNTRIFFPHLGSTGGLDALNRLCRLTLRLQQDQAYEAALVIDQQEEEGLAAWGSSA